MVPRHVRDRFEDLFPICALAALFTQDATAGRRVLHDQLAALIRRHEEAFGDELRDLLRPFYHAVLYAPWAMKGYSDQPLADYPCDEQLGAARLLCEHGCGSLTPQMYDRDLELFLLAKARGEAAGFSQAWSEAHDLLRRVSAHLMVYLREILGILTRTGPRRDPRMDDEGGSWTLTALRRAPHVSRPCHLKLLQGGS